MDIRQAKKFNNGNIVGTTAPESVTPEKERVPAPEINEQTGAASDMSNSFSSDVVTAQYLTYLKEHDITEDDIAQILETLVTTGNVVWSFDLFDRVPVSFKIRETWLNDYILELLDKETASDSRVSMVRYNNLIAICNLAASLTKYGKDSWVIKSREDFDKARERVRNFTYIVQNALVNKLAVFDRAIAVATSDWAVRNFTKAGKDK